MEGTGLDAYLITLKGKGITQGCRLGLAKVLDLVYYYGDQQTVDLMATIQAYLADVGIKVVPRKLEGDLSSQLWVAPNDPINGTSAVDWDLAYAGLAVVSEYEYYNRFHSGGATNSHTPGNLELDALLDDVNKTNNIAEQKEYFNKIQQFENKYLPIYLYIISNYSLLKATDSLAMVLVMATSNMRMIGDPDLGHQTKHRWTEIMKANGGPSNFLKLLLSSHPHSQPESSI